MLNSAKVDFRFDSLNHSLATDSVKFSVVEETQDWLEHQDTTVAKRISTFFSRLAFFYLAAQVLRFIL